MPPEDYLDIDGLRNFQQSDISESKTKKRGKKFLSIWFQCCHTYGRINRNKAGSMYAGHCPRCGARVQAMIGPGGTSQRMFKTG
ncbi:MAG: hypothetical protein O7G85_03820 [Planctomycetota bacterium]|nr:hypothetical protein [Planctomycetota bacterium]